MLSDCFKFKASTYYESEVKEVYFNFSYGTYSMKVTRDPNLSQPQLLFISIENYHEYIIENNIKICIFCNYFRENLSFTNKIFFNQALLEILLYYKFKWLKNGAEEWLYEYLGFSDIESYDQYNKDIHFKGISKKTPSSKDILNPPVNKIYPQTNKKYMTSNSSNWDCHRWGVIPNSYRNNTRTVRRDYQRRAK